VLFELVLQNTAPAVLVMCDPDGLACVGAIVAQEIFPTSQRVLLDIVCLGGAGYEQLLSLSAAAADTTTETAAAAVTGRVLPMVNCKLLQL
jgi:hypothetical protein